MSDASPPVGSATSLHIDLGSPVPAYEQLRSQLTGLMRRAR